MLMNQIEYELRNVLDRLRKNEPVSMHASVARVSTVFGAHSTSNEGALESLVGSSS